jgi:hypothetical protein
LRAPEPELLRELPPDGRLLLADGFEPPPDGRTPPPDDRGAPADDGDDERGWLRIDGDDGRDRLPTDGEDEGALPVNEGDRVEGLRRVLEEPAVGSRTVGPLVPALGEDRLRGERPEGGT